MNHLTLLCQIVDNLGDAGVALRLARQWLSRHPADRITLLTDAKQPFERLIGQSPYPVGLHIIETLDPAPPFEWGNVIIELFGTPVPTRAKQYLANRTPRPVWINLEYLSAEDWVEQYHGLSSTDPSTGWQQLFFFPGFTDRTGGLMGPEPCGRDAKTNTQSPPGNPLNVTPQHNARQQINNASSMLHAYTLAYTLEPLRHLQGLSARGADLVFATEDHTGSWAATPATTPRQNKPHLHFHIANASTDTLPLPGYVPVEFVDQVEFDALLLRYDLLFVRGEDSFVRAQLTGRPLVWQIYPTADGAHWIKLEAFFNRYAQGMTEKGRNALWTLWMWWNRHPSIEVNLGHAIVSAALSNWSEICSNAARWQAHVLSRCTLLDNLHATIETTQQRLQQQ